MGASGVYDHETCIVAYMGGALIPGVLWQTIGVDWMIGPLWESSTR